jgi:hypothetical protein
MQQTDPQFYDRADAHIHLSNDQIADDVSRGKVSASMLYATSRFNAWVSATGFDSSDAMKAGREEALGFFTAQYRLMLEENFDDYAANFERYMATRQSDV